jgi:regulator of cell morphogenesis and NO signaling
MEIAGDQAETSTPVERWEDAPLDELVDHILMEFHQPLRQDLLRLEAMAREVVDLHREEEPVMLPEVLSTLLGLKAELEDHMAKEEEILFPMIKQDQGWMADGPISVMRHEHDSATAALALLRRLTADYRLPAEACATWKALWHGLAALGEALHRHIHLENDILFPRALDSLSAKALPPASVQDGA